MIGVDTTTTRDAILIFLQTFKPNQGQCINIRTSVKGSRITYIRYEKTERPDGVNVQPGTYIAELLQTMENNYKLRTPHFVIPRYNTVTYEKHFIGHLRPYLWCKLPGNVRTQCDSNNFKIQIKKMDLESVFLEKSPAGCFLCDS